MKACMHSIPLLLVTAEVVVAGWLSVLLCFHFCRVVLLHSVVVLPGYLFPPPCVPACFPLCIYFIRLFPIRLFFFCKWPGGVLTCIGFALPRVHCGWHCMAKSSCCIGNVYEQYLRHVVDYHSESSSLYKRRHRHEHWRCWM